ncbi:PREDICTED: probable protein S-acyltransferase 5 [Tarenaya hassleriana]|uniref:probable protein S-acyltransferase 5 n=1 Tax=Tarenaya hassleriana TaxID=28532 RepID=UPI00053C519C|nr:PREDICTED: probable protein S-acyltransferase 5 [Tarenaya hassleriana]
MLGSQPLTHRPGAPVTASAAPGDTDGGELIRTYKAWKGNNVFFLGGRLIFGPDAQSILLTIFLITAPVTVFCVFVARKLMDDFPHNRGVSILAIAIGLNLLDLIFLLLTSGRDPGIIPRNLYPPEPENYEGDGEPRISRTPPLRLPRTKDMVVNGITVKIKYCDTCMLYRPPRASHCSICNNCVQKFDHHCPWLGQCIGLRNYRFYFMFVLCSTLLCIYVHVFCWIYVKRIMDGEKTTIWKALIKTPASIALIIYTFISVWFVGGLTGFHLYLISTNQSTYENFRYRYDRHENPFNKGILLNFLEVFCSSVSPSRNNFREKTQKEPVIPPRIVNGGGLSSPSLEKVVHDIEMGRKPVWHETVEEELGVFDDKDGETALVSRDFSRILPPEETEGRGIMHSRESSRGRRGGSWEVPNRFSEDIRRSGESESKRAGDDEDDSGKDEKEMDDVSRVEIFGEGSERSRPGERVTKSGRNRERSTGSGRL